MARGPCSGGDRGVPRRLDPVRAEQLVAGAGCSAAAARSRRGDDGAGRAAGPAALGGQGRAGDGHGLPHRAGPDRAGGRAAAGRVHHHLLQLALDLLDQHPDRRAGAGARHHLHPRHARGAAAAARSRGLRPQRRRPRRHHVRIRDHRARHRAGLGDGGAARGRGSQHPALSSGMRGGSPIRCSISACYGRRPSAPR